MDLPTQLRPGETVVWQDAPNLSHVYNHLQRDAKWIAWGLVAIALLAFIPSLSVKLTGYLLVFSVAISAIYLGALYAKTHPILYEIANIN